MTAPGKKGDGPREELHIRGSLAEHFLDCPRRALGKLLPQAKHWGVRDDGKFVSIAAAMGTALHYWAENREGKTAGELLKKAVEGKFLQFDKTTGNEREAAAQLREMVRKFEEVYGADWREQGRVEEALETRVYVGEGGGKFVRLKGRVDRIDYDGTVRDLKTGVQRRMQHGVQLGIYAKLAKDNGYGEAEECVIHFVPRKGGEITEERYDAKDCAVQAQNAVIAAVRAKADFDRTGDPGRVAANPKSMMCNRNYCLAHGTDWCKMSKDKP